MEENTSNDILKHYTTVECLYKILQSGFKMSDGSNWSDKNDYRNIRQYAKLSKEKNILVLCFCDGSGNVWHWHKSGARARKDKNIWCCLEIKREEFLDKINNNPSYKARNVEYCSNNEINNSTTVNLPFLKRKEYAIEKEFRIICFENSTEEKFIEISNELIHRIVIGNCAKSKYNDIKKRIASIQNGKFAQCTIGYNHLNNSEKWDEEIKKLIDKNNTSNI